MTVDERPLASHAILRGWVAMRHAKARATRTYVRTYYYGVAWTTKDVNRLRLAD